MKPQPPEGAIRIADEVSVFMEREISSSAGAHGVMAALSGGADSVALLLALHRWSLQSGRVLAAVHLNHGLRGAPSDGDEEFVRALCAELEIALHVAKVAVGAERRPGESIEMAARNARFAFFRQTAEKTGLDTVALGHHRDDLAETLLMRLSEGAGSGGLSGMRPVREFSDGLRLVRPLLAFSRQDLCAWLRGLGRNWREDSSNADRTFFRNRVRHEWMPWLEEHGKPKLRSALARSADILGAEDEWLETVSRRIYQKLHGGKPSEQGGWLDAEGLLREPLALRRRVARLWLRDLPGVPRPDYELVDRVLRLAAGEHSPFMLPDRRLLHREGACLKIDPVGTGRISAFDRALNVPGLTVVPGARVRIGVRIERGIVRGRGRVGQLPAAVSLDAEVWAGRTLRIRNRRPGDRIRPTGMSGSRKLQDVFVDAGVSREKRDLIPVLVCGDEVLWVPGYRVAHNWRVRDARRKALQVVVERKSDRPRVAEQN